MNIGDYKLIAIIVIAILTVVTAAVYIVSDTDSSNGDSEVIDVVGNWYCVDKYYYNADGTMGEDTLENNPLMSNNDLAIYDADDGMFYGMFSKVSVSGIVADNILFFSTKMGNDLYRVNGTFLNSNLLVASIEIVSYADDGTVASTSANVLTFTKDRMPQTVENNVPDLSGKWTSFSNTWYDGTLTEWDQTNVTITQKGALFDLVFDSYFGISSFELIGSLHTDDNGTTVGYLVGSAGNSWELNYSGETLNVCASVNAGTTGTAYIGLTRGGETGKTSQVANLDSTTWRAVNNIAFNQYGGAVYYPSQYYLEFGVQENNSFVGTFHRGVTEFDYAGYLFNDSTARLSYALVYDDASLMASFGWFDGEVLYIADVRSYDDGSITTSLVTYNKLDVKKEYDLTGYWYLTNIIGYNNYDEYVVHPDDLSSLMDLTIYSLEDDLFYGYSCGSAMTGSYIDGFVTMSGSDLVYGGEYYTTGWLTDSNTMIINVVFRWDSDPITTAAYMGQYTRDRGAAPLQDVDIDIVGDWVLESGKVYDGEMHDVEGTTLRIDNYQHNAFIGSFKRSVGGVVTDVSFKGSVSAVIANDRAYGMLIDEIGGRWYIDMDNESITLRIADNSGHIILPGAMLAVERVYIRANTDISDPDNSEYHQMLGTWESISLRTVSGEGDRYYTKEITKENMYTLEVTGQDGIFAVGKGHQGRLNGDFSLVFGPNVLSDVAAIIASDYGYGTQFGFGWFEEVDGVLHMYLVEMFQDTAGVWNTQIADLVKTTTSVGA